MKDPQLTPIDEKLINELRQSSVPEMNLEAVEKLRQNLFAEIDMVFSETPTKAPVRVVPPRRPFPTGLLVAVVIMLVAIAAFAVLNSLPEEVIEEERIDTPTVTSTLTLTSSPTATETLTPTQTVTENPTATASATFTQASTLTPSPTQAEAAAPMIIQTITSAPGSTGPATIIIEGPVQAIASDHIVVFDMVIEIDAVRDILAQIRTGTLIRIEGETRLETDRIIIRAISITIMPVPGSGPAQQPGPSQQQAPPLPPQPSDGRLSVTSRSS